LRERAFIEPVGDETRDCRISSLNARVRRYRRTALGTNSRFQRPSRRPEIVRCASPSLRPPVWSNNRVIHPGISGVSPDQLSRAWRRVFGVTAVQIVPSAIEKRPSVYSPRKLRVFPGQRIGLYRVRLSDFVPTSRSIARFAGYEPEETTLQKRVERRGIANEAMPDPIVSAWSCDIDSSHRGHCAERRQARCRVRSNCWRSRWWPARGANRSDRWSSRRCPSAQSALAQLLLAERPVLVSLPQRALSSRVTPLLPLTNPQRGVPRGAKRST
jgi:hypothetical protein